MRKKMKKRIKEKLFRVKYKERVRERCSLYVCSRNTDIIGRKERRFPFLRCLKRKNRI